MYAEGLHGLGAVLGHPCAGEGVEAHSRRLAECKRLIALHILGVVEFLVAYALDFLGFEHGGVVVVGCLENLVEEAVGVEHHLVDGGNFEAGHSLHRCADGLHEHTQHFLELR